MRKHRPQEQWQTLVDKQRDSDLSAMQFCKQEGIGYASFCSWRKRLTEEPAADSAGSGEAGFLNLSSLMGASSSAGSDLGWNIVLSLGNGVEAQKDHPEQATEALQRIAKLYSNEETIKTKGLTGEKKRQYRLEHSQPVVSHFFQGCRDQLECGGLLPSDPLTKALNDALNREASLNVFLEDPDVQPDTHPLEQGLTAHPVRPKLAFCWTELGAEHLGIIQSLITTCKLHDLNAYTDRVDVLQRISQHPASQVADLTPRFWKLRFADKPLRSLVDPRHPDRQASRSL